MLVPDSHSASAEPKPRPCQCCPQALGPSQGLAAAPGEATASHMGLHPVPMVTIELLLHLSCASTQQSQCQCPCGQPGHTQPVGTRTRNSGEGWGSLGGTSNSRHFSGAREYTGIFGGKLGAVEEDSSRKTVGFHLNVQRAGFFKNCRMKVERNSHSSLA